MRHHLPMTPVHRAFVATLSLLVFAALGDAAAQPRATNPTGRPIELSVPVEDGDAVVGTLLLRIEADGALSVATDGLLALFADDWGESLVATVRAAADGERLPLASLEGVLDTVEFDQARLTLRLVAAAAARETRRIRFGLDAAGDFDERGLTAPAPFSAFTNVRASFVRARTERDAAGDVEELTATEDVAALQLDGLARLRGPVLAWDLLAQGEDGEVGGLARRSTQLLIDLPEREARLTLGDIALLGGGFRASADILGVGFGRDFALAPGRAIRPFGRYGFTLERPATVSVVANGETLRTLELGPGNYELEDLPLSGGANRFELVVEDAAGASERLAFVSTYDSGLLDVDETDFAVFAGVLAESGTGSTRYLEDRPLMSASARAGVFPSLTAGLAVQFDRDASQIGLSLLRATPIGPLAVETVLSSHRERGAGFAVAAGWRWLSTGASERRFTLSGEYRSVDFDSVDGREGSGGDAAADGSGEYEIVASFGQRLGAAAYLNVAVAERDEGGSGGPARLADVSMQGRLLASGRLSWLVRGRYERTADDDGQAYLGIGLGYRFDASNSVSTLYSGRDGSASIDYSRQVDPGRIGGYSAALGLDRDERDALAVEAAFDYTGNRFVAGLRQGVRDEPEEEGSVIVGVPGVGFDGDPVVDADGVPAERTLETGVRLETALALAGRRVAVGRPIGGSFAIVGKHPSLGARTLRLNPDDGGDASRSDRLGPALLPDVGRYGVRGLEYSVDDLPLGYDLGAGLFRLRPPLGGGYALTVGSGASVTVVGNLVDADDGEPLALVTGRAVPLDDPTREPIVFFTNRAGKFALSGVSEGRYRMEIDGAPPRGVEIDVVVSEESFVRIGDLAVP